MRSRPLALVGLAALAVAAASGCGRKRDGAAAGAGEPARRESASDSTTTSATNSATTPGNAADGRTPLPDPVAHDRVDVIETALELDLSRHAGHATVTLETTGAGATFEVGDLDISGVSVDGAAAVHRREGAALHLRLPVPEGASASDAPRRHEVRFDYAYRPRDEAKGPYEALTLTWPYYCGRVFPCQSEPADGLRFTAKLTGVPEGQQAIYPARIAADAPPYMFAWTVGDYETLELGATAAGTKVRVLAPAEALDDARAGTPHLRDAFDFLERTYGPYAYGDEVASVWVDWGTGGFGGMEHHPYWHVAAPDFSGQTVHVHEAAHGWFGDAVRIACWEDFVLSEALASYLAARALEAAGGISARDRVWAEYQQDLDGLGDGPQAARGWPEGCGTHDVLEDGIFSVAPYMRGAFFFRALERKIGRDALDASLRGFYLTHRGQAARFDDLLESIARDTGYDPKSCAESWLRAQTRPSVDTCP